MKEWTPDDLRLAIKNDIDLASLLQENRDDPTAGLLTGITGKYDVAGDNRVNVGNVLLWFAEKRPDLYKVLTENEEGIKWITWNMNKLKMIL